jgi:hypothetical protein
LCVFDYAFVPENRYVVAVACIMNGMDGLKYSFIPVEFLSKLSSNLDVDLDDTTLERACSRLWFLYSCSAHCRSTFPPQYQDSKNGRSIVAKEGTRVPSQNNSEHFLL